MKQYKHAVWDLIDMFDSFNIVHNDRSFNVVVENLTLLGSRFENCTISPYCEYDVEVLTRSSIPNNIEHWNFFEDDAQV